MGCLRMRRLLALVLLLVGGAIAVPVIFLCGGEEEQLDKITQEPSPEVKLLVCESGQVISLPLEEYVVGVVAAEMPAAFPLEALKAQAVAARTYTLKRLQTADPAAKSGETASGTPAGASHPQAHICTDFNHCQAWIDKGEMAKRWGSSCDKYYKKICSAVAATRGQVIYYNQALIDPVYHSTSNGRTENSEDVWGTKVPYLRSVASGWDKESPKFHTTLEVPLEVISKKLGSSDAVQPVSFWGDSAIIRPLDYTSTGRLKTVMVAGKTIPSTKLRQALGLPSTDLTWSISRGKVLFNATGNGHGVGMSQYGAKGMAQEGSSYEEILRHYYTGVEIRGAY